MAEIKLVHVPGQKPIRILKWLVKKGEWIKHGTPLAAYRTMEEEAKSKEVQLKSKHVGKVKMFLMHEGQVSIPDGVLMEIEGCAHPVIMKEMCAECGQDLRIVNETNSKRHKHKTHSATVAMIPSIPELKISTDQAEEIAQQDKSRLHKMQKLVLLVDLDQTLIHTTQDPGLAALCQSDEDFYSFQLSRNDPMLFTKLRPHCREFLEEVSQRYELQIVTFGSRQYAHKIADFIDKEKKYFAHRILSRDECIHPFKKSGNLRHLFPCGDSMVCIIDDRDDVWNAVPNLIMVKKYNYFQGTGDINNPYGEKGKAAEKAALIKSQDSQQSPRKRKSEEEIVQDGPEADVKRLKNEKSATETQVQKLDTNENKIDDVKSDVDEDLNMSSDSDSSSESSSNSSSSSEEEQQQSLENNEENMEIGNGEKQEKIGKSEVGSAEKVSVGHEKDQNGVTGSEVIETTEQKKVNGDEVQPDASSSIETVPLSSQESEARDKNSQDAIDRDMSGFSGASQEFTTVLSSQEGSVADSRKKFKDSDDYLPYLKDILVQIHATYYEAYDKFLKKEFKDLPDVRGVVPFLRSKVLYGCCIVFTGVIPQTFHLPPHNHRAHVIARQLGAKVEEQVTDQTTHLIGGKKGTTKYQDAEKRKNVKMVSVEWLWCCSERWERVAEEFFPIADKIAENTSKTKSEQTGVSEAGKVIGKDSVQPSPTNTYDPVTGKLIKKVKDPRFSFVVAESHQRRKDDGRHNDLYSSLQVPNAVVPIVPTTSKDKSSKFPQNWKHNPLSKSKTAPYGAARRSRKRSMAEIVGYGYSLSTDDIADMDKEVHDLLGSSDEEEGEEKDLPPVPSSQLTDESVGDLPKEDPETVEEMKDSQEKKESSSSDEAEDGNESSEDDEMEALLNAEMHFDDVD